MSDPLTDLELADLIADRLFRNGSGQIADQLALMQGDVYPRGAYLGGWSKPAVRDQVLKALSDSRVSA